MSRLSTVASIELFYQSTRSAQNVPPMPEEVENRCIICKDTRNKGDFYGLIDCCEHVHCYECVLQWGNLCSNLNKPQTCPTCKQSFSLLMGSFIIMSPDRKEAFKTFSSENQVKTFEWADRMGQNDMKLEYCTFNCGFAEVLSDGTLMCPHGLYDKKRYEKEQKKYTDQEVQTDPVECCSNAPFLMDPIVNTNLPPTHNRLPTVVTKSTSQSTNHQMSEEVENQCMICFEDVKKTGDFFGLLDCCGHVHCWTCIRQWKNHQRSQKIYPFCPCCRARMRMICASLIVIPHDNSDKKERFKQFSQENLQEVRDWAARMKQNGMRVEKCEFNCGFAEVMSDGSLMCPHGYYDQDQEVQTEPMQCCSIASLFTTLTITNHLTH